MDRNGQPETPFGIERDMGMSIYAVRKRRGAWTIFDQQKPAMLLDNYEEALGIARAAAGVLVNASIETVYFEISHSPARSDDGSVEGVVSI
jgi:hypothetical protein